MGKLDRKLQLGRYDALLARHGDQELLSSFDALMREVATKLRRRGAPKARQAKHARTQRA
jgi:ATP phosphoribosyltransferase regulatory subunit HisZ